MTRGEVASDTSDGRDTDPRVLVNFSVGATLLQPADHGPAVTHRLKLSGRAKIFKEGPKLARITQAGHRFIQRFASCAEIVRRFVSGGFHGDDQQSEVLQCVNALVQ